MYALYNSNYRIALGTDFIGVVTDKSYFVILSCNIQSRSFSCIYSYALPEMVGNDFLEISPDGTEVLIGIYCIILFSIGGYHKQFCVLKLQIEIDNSLSRPVFQCIDLSLSQPQQCLYYGIVLLQSQDTSFVITLQQTYQSSTHSLIIHSIKGNSTTITQSAEIRAHSTSYRLFQCISFSFLSLYF